MLLSLKYERNFAIVFDNFSDFTPYYYEHVIDIISMYNGEIVYDSHNKTIESTDIDDYITAIGNYDSVITLFLHNNVDILKEMINKKKTGNYLPSQYPILIYEGGIKSSEILTSFSSDLASLEGYMFITPYSTEVINSKTSNFNTITTSYPSVDKEQASLSVGIIDMLGYAGDHVPSTNIHTLFTYVFDKTFEFPGGEISMLPNHYTMTTTYIASFNNDGSISYPYTLPIDFTFQYDQLYGKTVNKTCDFLTNSETGLTEVDYLPIIFIQDMKLYESVVMYEIIKEMFDDINEEVYLFIFIFL